MLSFLLGAAAGAAHVITGPDHWVAITPLSIAQPHRALRVGVRWGIGHALGILALGALGLFLRDALSLDEVSSFAEATVGVVLVISGAWALHRSRALLIHSHPHTHHDEPQGDNPKDEHEHQHEHVHLHVGVEDHEREHEDKSHMHAALGFGLLHGVAGASQLWALIPTLALPKAQAISYLVGFLVSSVLAMGGFTYAVGRWAQLGRAGSKRGQMGLNRAFQVVGWGSIALGVYWTGVIALIV